METIRASIYWCDKNFCCGWGFPEFGAILATSKSFEGVKSAFENSLGQQISDMQADGESLPEWIVDRQFVIEYEVQASAILRNAEQYTSMAAISRVTGINQKLLSNYASSVKVPGERQKQRIIDGLHKIGQAILLM